ncbi:hypothetical protein MVEN_00830700 [Mycena venus]|uniref:RING-CH-type domain-containing protein n=1 Tax=Mycena venus TaxID=2733690 RepID=A0A8H6YH24_9AGAR|nr:hypothetical protein MVEN_00830700 [Mycena venus]
MNHYDDDVPTVDDLRVKSCFICLEEERAPDTQLLVRPGGIKPTPNKLNPWVHPCPNCALVAHDRCLLRWISSLPLKRRAKRKDRGPGYIPFVLDTFKCPHCKCPYELANPRPSRMHRLAMIYDAIYMILAELVNIGCTSVGLATLYMIPVLPAIQRPLVVLSGMFIQEVAFLESYLGPRMFNLLITNDVNDLIRSFFIVLPTVPFRLLLPGTLPKFVVPLYISFPFILHGMTEAGALGPLNTLDRLSDVSTTSRPMISMWPPSPALLGLVIVPLIRPVYNRLLSSFRTWVLGSTPPHRRRRYLNERWGLFGLRPRPPTPPADNDDPDPPPLVIADQIILKDQSSLTHDVLYAISSTTLPRLFGNLLLRGGGVL